MEQFYGKNDPADDDGAIAIGTSGVNSDDIPRTIRILPSAGRAIPRDGHLGYIGLRGSGSTI